ncbi:restriction endonuclease [Pseudomonas taeanensis]|nr:restriction endonuclease [Pseudomonas taeanensis]
MRQLERQAVRQQRISAAQEKEAHKLEKTMYLEDRHSEVADLNTELSNRVSELQDILPHTLCHDDRISFDSLRHTTPFPSFQPPPNLAPGLTPQKRLVPPPKGIQKLIPGAAKRHALRIEDAERENEATILKFNAQEAKKRAEFQKVRADYDAEKLAFDDKTARHNSEIDAFEASYFAKDTDAIIAYNEMVLTRSEYPAEGFQQLFRLAYAPDSSELVVEYDMPDVSVVPVVSEYRYIKTRDEIDSKARKPAEIKQRYQDIIASIALRTLHELFEADQANALRLVTFNGMLDTHDPASGREVRIPVVSVRATKDEFLTLNLERVDKVLCLRNLGAQVSSRPDELQAIKPIVEFDMIDRRFIDQGDALSGLESRPNLIELTPNEFEVLVANLFSKMGLDTKLTRSSRDGGVDAIAFDTRPVLGGKVVIQAKRYRDTVGVSAVRDLYGTMLNEGANKGILVCTSRYGPDAYNFSKDKPIELIDGGGLLFLLREHTGTEARITV